MHKKLRRMVAGSTLVCVLLGIVGCMAFQAPERGLRPTAAQPLWDPEVMVEHLRFFSSAIGGGAAASPSGHEQAARYAAARMREYRLQPAGEDTYELAYLSSASRRSPAGGASEKIVAGYVAGKHPEHAQELVIVCADLGAPEKGQAETGLDSLGVGAAALLEVARNYSLIARYGLVPERSVLFVLWPGSRPDRSDARGFLSVPPWALKAARALIYVGLPPADHGTVRETARAHGFRFYAVEPSQTEVSTPGETASDSARSEHSPALQLALQQVWPMARRTHELLRMEVLSGDAPVPHPGDTLRAPLER